MNFEKFIFSTALWTCGFEAVFPCASAPENRCGPSIHPAQHGRTFLVKLSVTEWSFLKNDLGTQIMVEFIKTREQPRLSKWNILVALPSAKLDTATPSIAEWQEMSNYWPESQCQGDLLIQTATGRLGCERSCCLLPKYTFLHFRYKVISLKKPMDPDGGDCSFTGTAELFLTLASYSLSVTSDCMCNKWKRNCVQIYSVIYSFMKLRVFPSNNAKTSTLLILWGHAAAMFSGFLSKDFYLQVY